MAVFPYKPEQLSPDSQARLSDIASYGMQTRAMLSALGDYWTAYYRDTGPIAAGMTGAVTAFSREYTHILDMVRASNILDVPITDSDQFELIVISSEDFVPVYAEDGVAVDHYFVAIPGIVNTEFLTSSLFESRVVLEQGKHFEVVREQGCKFYVDIFNDPGITGYTYGIDDVSSKQVLLWACDIAFSSMTIYNRYGRFLYRKCVDGEQYKWLVSALMLFYENAKTTKRIQNVLNIMYGVPYTRYNNEVIQEIYYVDKNLQRLTEDTEEPYRCIQTDRAKYYTYAFSDLLVKEGDVVPQFSLLASFNKVEDYIDTPDWWVDAAFADKLVAGASDLTLEEKNELMDKVLKYNTVHINIGVSFDTYQTYLQQIDEFFKIIESGFPVYLYPVVDSIFKAVFIDKVDIEEELRIVRLMLRMSTVYDWGNHAKFDGNHVYYMQPSHDHGYGLQPSVARFDGSGEYTVKDYLTAVYPDARRFNAAHGYDTDWKFSHANSNEILNITSLGLRSVDEYPWGTSEHLGIYRARKYSGGFVADGSYSFGYADERLDNESMDIRVVAAPLEDVFDSPKEDSGMPLRVGTHFSDRFDSDTGFLFSGEHTYSGIHAVQGTYLAEDFRISVSTRS